MIVRKLETSVMAITPHLLEMESETVLTQYLITNWTLEYKNTSNVDAGIQMTIVLKRRILNAILTAEAPPDSDYLSLLRYLSFFSFR